MTRGFRDEDRGDDVTLEGVTATAESAKALCVELNDDTEAWVPKSQITDDSEVYAKGHQGRLVITRWLAREKGWA